MQHNVSISNNQIPADFTLAHIALLIEIRDKAIATVRKDGAKMSDLNAALNILIKVEKQFYTLTHRRPPGQKTRQSRHEPPQIIPFTPAPGQAMDDICQRAIALARRSVEQKYFLDLVRSGRLP